MLSKLSMLRTFVRPSSMRLQPLWRRPNALRWNATKAEAEGAASKAETEAAAKAEAEGAASKTEAKVETEAPEAEPTTASGRSANVPMIATVGRYTKQTGKFIFIAGLIGVAGLSAYSFYQYMGPGLSAQSVFAKASEAIKQNPEVVSLFGENLKTFGDERGSKQGRRYNVPEYTYTKDGVQHLRIRFQIEGEHKQKGLGFAEMAKDKPHDFVYLFVQAFPSGRVLTLVDNRKPEKSIQQRQRELALRFQETGSIFFMEAAGAVSNTRQRLELGSAWDHLNKINCTTEKDRCLEYSVEEGPAWRIKGRNVTGFKTLSELEDLMNK